MQCIAKMLKIASFALLLYSLTSCGGGGKGSFSPPPSPPTSNPPSNNEQITTTLTANPNKVCSGESVTLTIVTSLQPSDVEWKQNPANPQGNFQKLNVTSARWQAPLVNSATQFQIIAVITFPVGFSLEVSTTVTVEPIPVTLPQVYISYPWSGNDDIRTVAEGVKLQIQGEVYPGTYPITKLRVVDQDGTLLQAWSFSGGRFEVDLERFGSIGRKRVKVEAVDSQGNVGNADLELIHDPIRLEQLARDFLRQYCTGNTGKRLYRFGDLTDGPFSQPVRIYLWPEIIQYRYLIEKACEFWSRYTNINFLVTTDSTVNLPVITIRGRFNENPSYAALTERGYDSTIDFKVALGNITLYAGWLRDSEEWKWITLAHELGHVLLTQDNNIVGSGHTDNGSFMDPRGGPFFHSYMQKAVRILYSKNPGDPL